MPVVLWLQGKKTYIVAGLIALATFAKVMGWVDEATYDTIVGLLLGGGLAALRAGIAKV